jgi:ribose transport system permease protein
MMVGLTLLALLWQRRTAFGRMLYAIGTSSDAAYIAGLPVKRVTILCYAISGAAAGFAGVLIVGFSKEPRCTAATTCSYRRLPQSWSAGPRSSADAGAISVSSAARCCWRRFSTMITALGIPAGWRAIIYGTVILLALLTLQEELHLWSKRLRSDLGVAFARKRQQILNPRERTAR